MSGGQPWPEWRKPHLGSTWRDEWRKGRLCCHTRAPNLISVSCVCWCGCAEARAERITPTNTCMDYTAAELALENKHLKPKKCKAPTHRESVHNKRCITNKHGRLQTIYTQTHIDERLQRIRTWTDRNSTSQKHTVGGSVQKKVFSCTLPPTYGNRCVQGIIFTDPPPPLPPYLPERKEAVRRLFPDRRPAQFSPKLVFHRPSTRHMTPEHHVPRPNRRLSQTAGTAKRNSSPDNLPRPANIPRHKLPAAQYSSQNLEGTSRCKDKPAPHPSSWEPFGGVSQSQVLDRRLSCRRRTLNETQVRLTCSFVVFFVFCFCSVAGEVLRPEELPCTFTNGHLQQQPSWQTFPFSVLPGTCSV